MSKKASDIKVVVLGGGVIGLTTAIILKLHGFQVTVVSKHKFDKLYSDKLDDRPAELASIHAAASVIPHSVDHPSEKEILSISQKFFHRLAFSAGFGVRVQRHYELSEKPVDPPEYARVVKDFTLLDERGTGWVNDKNIPRRKGSAGVWGWYFNAFFAEAPTYMNALYELYKMAGGRLRPVDIVNIEQIEKMEGDIIVNCLGRWAVELFPEDKEHTKIIRGHMIKVGIHQVPHDERDQYFSYNYSPDNKIYSREYPGKDEHGNILKDDKGKNVMITDKADVYFYPRSDGWLLGGSRQEGFPGIGEAWRDIDEQISGPTFKKDNWETEVPKPIWTLNRELLLDITGIDIADEKYRSFAYVGYRFGRKPIRIAMEKELKIKDKLLIHNYGHGGAGYTLSWGSAYEVLKCIEQKIKPVIEIDRTVSMATGYFESMKQVLTDLVVEEYINRNDFTPYMK
jgi:D-amino-acid oxidase